jgi:type I restriction enzyme, R subunit
MITEADTCRKYVVPKLYAAGWDDDQISEQKTFTDGRILVTGRNSKRGPPKRLDYLLKYRRDYPLAVVEAKAAYLSPMDGLQQAIEYALILDLPFAYATNGHGIVERDLLTGIESELEAFPTPQELWNRVRAFKGLSAEVENKLLTPYFLGDRVPRYYQTTAINRAIEAILTGKTRALLTLATGTGKTEIAFQIVWKLWQSRWNTRGEYRRPRVLFLADRSILVDDPKDKTFFPLGAALTKLEGGKVNTSRDVYFSTYQSLAEDANRPGLYKEYAPDFFDLVIIDEAHRGSANDEGSWRDILEHFRPAVQLGMTATPLREDSRDTYKYFGNPLYIYSLAQGIQDGFLAPYQVRRVVTDLDAAGFRPHPGMTDARGREIPDGEYGTKDFEATLSVLPRTEAVAAHLVDYLRKTDIMAKTIVFCHDQEHAAQMRFAIAKLVPDLMRKYPDYVCRVTADEGDIGKGYLSSFQELEKSSPVILTTSKLLSTGVDAPTVKNVVIFRVIGTMTEFKQIIGRGTRVREDYGKLFFTILDYTGSATMKFADPDFDGTPTEIVEGTLTVELDSEPETDNLEPTAVPPSTTGPFKSDDEGEPRKYLIRDGISVTIALETVQELDAQGRKLRTVEFTKHTAEQVLSLVRSSDELRDQWVDGKRREAIVHALEEKGIALEHLYLVTSGEESDAFDLLCHLAFDAPLLTRKQRAEAAKRRVQDAFQTFGKTALGILEDLLERYVETDIGEVTNTKVFKLLPTTKHLNTLEVANVFGGVPQLQAALEKFQAILYA